MLQAVVCGWCLCVWLRACVVCVCVCVVGAVVEAVVRSVVVVEAGVVQPARVGEAGDFENGKIPHQTHTNPTAPHPAGPQMLPLNSRLRWLGR